MYWYYQYWYTVYAKWCFSCTGAIHGLLKLDQINCIVLYFKTLTISSSRPLTGMPQTGQQPGMTTKCALMVQSVSILQCYSHAKLGLPSCETHLLNICSSPWVLSLMDSSPIPQALCFVIVRLPLPYPDSWLFRLMFWSLPRPHGTCTICPIVSPLASPLRPTSLFIPSILITSGLWPLTLTRRLTRASRPLTKSDTKLSQVKPVSARSSFFFYTFLLSLFNLSAP